MKYDQARYKARCNNKKNSNLPLRSQDTKDWSYSNGKYPVSCSPHEEKVWIHAKGIHTYAADAKDQT